MKFYSDGAIAYIDETATGAAGVCSTLTSLNGQVLAHEWFNNAAVDDLYPYVDMELGSGLAKAKQEDTWWEIVPGKTDGGDPYLVSLESYNKPGLYVTVSGGIPVLCQDHNKSFAAAQTFRTIEGLAGEGVSFESIAAPGLYLTLAGGEATLTNGSDATACSFRIEPVNE